MLSSFTKPNLQGSSFGKLLLLLEKDLSRNFFYCHSCNRLHRFSSSWSPGRGPDDYYSELPCRPRMECLGDHPLRLGIGFHHA